MNPSTRQVDESVAGLFLLICFIVIDYFELEERRQFQLDVDMSYTKAETRTFDSFFQSLLPLVFSSSSWLVKYVKSLFDQHVWMMFVYHSRHQIWPTMPPMSPRVSSPRKSTFIQLQMEYVQQQRERFKDSQVFASLEIVALMSRIIHFFLIDTIFVRFLFGDDGTCQGYTDESTCVYCSSLGMTLTD